MKRSLKAILTLFFVLWTFVFTEAVNAWWSNPKNMHFRLLNLSQGKLLEAGLFNMGILEIASNCPDGPNKSMEHKDSDRVKINYCATVGMALTGNAIGSVDCRRDCQSIADCMGRTFHYLEDQIDCTHADNHIEDSRNHAYNNFKIIKMNPRLEGEYIQKYNSILSNQSFMSLMYDIHRETSSLKSELSTANNKKDINIRSTERDEVLAKNFALIKASQDRLIDLYKAEFNAYASNTCKDTTAYCKGLEKRVKQACQINNITAAKGYIDLAKQAVKKDDPECKKLHENQERFLQQNGCSAGPVTINLAFPQGNDVTSGGLRKDIVLTVSGDVQFPLTYFTKVIKAPNCNMRFDQGSQTLNQNMMSQRGSDWQFTIKGSIYCNAGSNQQECQSFIYTYQHWVETADKRRSNVIQKDYKCSSQNTTRQQTTFPNPMLNGRSLDHCLTFAKNCNKPVADQWCQKKGFRKASKWNIVSTKMTYLFSGEKCDPPTNCHTFSFIDCE